MGSTKINGQDFATLSLADQMYYQSQWYKFDAAKSRDPNVSDMAQDMAQTTGVKGDPLDPANMAKQTPAASQFDLTDLLVRGYQYSKDTKQITGSRRASFLGGAITNPSPLDRLTAPAGGKTLLGQ